MNLEYQWGVQVTTPKGSYIMDCSSRDNAEGTLEGMRHKHPELTCKLVGRIVAYGSWVAEKEAS